MFGFIPTLRRAFMSSSNKPELLQGVLAIHKPLGISSAQVLRDVETHFNPSRLFRPLLDAERDAITQEKRQQGNKYRRKKGPNRTQRVKLGHGGTLDPLATGVLIAGVGSGTKALSRYLGGCQKTYVAAVVFGCATDTYDNTGKVMARAPPAHVTRDAVERALDAFRGDIMQKPPVYSAIKFNGKKAYEIMREGGEPPKMEARPVSVYMLELVDWFPPGTHGWRYPQEEMEATAEEKQAALKASGSSVKVDDTAATAAGGEKRKLDEADSAETPAKKTKTESGAEPAEATPTEATPATEAAATEASAETATKEPTAAPLEDGTNAPAARIRMTVSSGFYVRTLCHDLGAAVGSLACMTGLVRTEQGDFQLGKNVLEFEDLEAGEDVWGPKVRTLLKDWTARQEPEKQSAQEHRQSGEPPKWVRAQSPTVRERSKSPAKSPVTRERSRSPAKSPVARERSKSPFGSPAAKQRSKSPTKPANNVEMEEDVPELD